MPDGEFAAPVTNQGELLGAISVRMPRAEPLSEAGERLIGDVASQAGLVLSNARLIEELRASRQRIVAAQDQARRRLERNIHDGAQQQLVALAVKLRLMGAMVGKDPEKERELADQLVADTQDALENLRDLARGIYPPLLQDKGLVSALEAQARKSAVPITVRAEGVARYPQELEAAVYFCTLEAMQNAAKYADATSVTVRLSEHDGRLTFDITDDGSGFDPSVNGHGSGLQGMADRLEALGGRLEVRSGVGHGTTIGGDLPARRWRRRRTERTSTRIRYRCWSGGRGPTEWIPSTPGTRMVHRDLPFVALSASTCPAASRTDARRPLLTPRPDAGCGRFHFATGTSVIASRATIARPVDT